MSEGAAPDATGAAPDATERTCGQSAHARPDGTVSPSLPQLVRWLLGITRPVHPPLLASLACRIGNLTLDLALFATAAGGVVHLATGSGGGGGAGIFVALVVLAMAKAAFFYAEQFSGHYVAFKALELLRTYVFAKLWPKAPAIVTHSRSGDVLASLTRDVDRIEVVYAHTFAPVVSAYVVGPVAILVGGLWLGWAPVSVAAGCLAVSLLVVPYLGTRTAFRSTAATLAHRRELAHHVSDSVFGLDDVLGYGLEAERLERMDAHGATIAGSARRARDRAAVRRGANVLLSVVAVLSVVWLGSETLSLVALAAAAAATLRTFEGPRGIEDATGYLDHSLAAARRLWEISNAPERVGDGPDRLVLDAAPAVRFEGVGYAYPGMGGQVLDDAVSDVSLDVPAGGHAILVGRSGSGKSTLVQLLLRYDDPHTGEVTIAGQPVGRYTLDSLRRAVVAVSQRNQLLDTTVAVNLRLGAPAASEAQLWRALQVAGLADDVRAMPAGLDTPVGRGGSALSGGQAQRLCLARALLMDPKVLVLDEFTANLDVELEEAIRASLAQWNPDLTIIEVTHRLRATAGADVVAVLDRGRLVLVGSPSEVTEQAIEQRFRATFTGAHGSGDGGPVPAG